MELIKLGKKALKPGRYRLAIRARNSSGDSSKIVIRRIRIKARALALRGGDVDCGSFASQATAQLYLLGGDPFGLDADGDVPVVAVAGVDERLDHAAGSRQAARVRHCAACGVVLQARLVGDPDGAEPQTDHGDRDGRARPGASRRPEDHDDDLQGLSVLGLLP